MTQLTYIYFTHRSIESLLWGDLSCKSSPLSCIDMFLLLLEQTISWSVRVIFSVIAIWQSEDEWGKFGSCRNACGQNTHKCIYFQTTEWKVNALNSKYCRFILKSEDDGLCIRLAKNKNSLINFLWCKKNKHHKTSQRLSELLKTHIVERLPRAQYH